MSVSREPIRLLVFEDDPSDVRLLKEMLSELHLRFELKTAGRLEEGLAFLKKGPFDTILLDLNLPDSWGLDTLRRVFSEAPAIPIIVLTGLHDETIGTQAISEGAQDYLVKGQIDPPLLTRAIQYAGQRKKIEKALQESEKRYKSLFNSSLDCIYRVDKKGAYVMMNQAGAEMFGYDSPESIIGIASSNFWADPHEQRQFVDLLRRDRMVKSYPIKAKKRNSEIIYLEASSYVLEDDQGTFIGSEGILRDISEKRKLEEQLLQSQKIEAIGTLAGGVAHDFNNILTAIIGYTYVVLMKLDKNDPLHYELQQVLAAADRATMLTQSLLAFSRKQTVHLAPLEINDVIRKFEKFITRLIREDVELHSVTGTEILMVMADKGQIEQALMNLVTNAQDAMPNGGRLTIETGRFHLDDLFIAAHGYGKPGNYVLISISDTGTGMDKQIRQKIFEPFFTTKEPGKGTGLGLALVYGTVKKHDGFIDVYSEPGVGTTFKIYLPLVEQPAGNTEKMQRIDTSSLVGGTETILVADDDTALRKLTSTVLTDFGYHVITASDGLEAIQKFSENKKNIQLVVLDVIMPKKNGKEIYQEISALVPGLRAIFMSGYPEGILDGKDMEGKHVAFLLKPVLPTDLLRKVRQLLDSAP